jgi:hypothetical protein
LSELREKKEYSQFVRTSSAWCGSQISFGSADEGGELALVLALDVLEGHDSCGLLVDNRAETSLALDDYIRNTHLATQSREEDDEFDGVDIVCNDDEGSLLGFDEGNNVVEAVFDKERLLVLGSLLLLGGGLGDGLETFLLLGLALGAVSTWIDENTSGHIEKCTYLLRSLNNWVAVFLSKVCENCAMAGGTLRRWLRMTF